MRSKIATEYEKKRWYRIVKTIYAIVFVLMLVIVNFVIWISASNDPGTDYNWAYLIANAVVIFGMGALEGLFWYIVRGKWGYPKDDTSSDKTPIFESTDASDLPY